MRTLYKKLLFLLLLLPFSALCQSTLSGVVLDKKTKMPLPGVNVVVQGATSGVSTDLDGKFRVEKLLKNQKIVFSFVGYKNYILSFGNQTTVTINLEEASNELNEVVVQVGYGTVKKKDATGSITVLSSKDFNKGAILSADQLLVGKAPGVRITNSGGQPDASPNIRIRGGASLSAEKSPLIVIDGVPIDNQNAAGNGNPLTLINPNDIDTFTILKDASATAIYGARASNGVILITTKKGSSGKTQYNFSSTTSFGSVQKSINMMDGPTFAAFVAKNHPTLVDKLGIPDPIDATAARIIYNTNWQDVIFRNTISIDNNFSARTNLFRKIPFRGSIGYNKTEGVVKTNDYKRLTLSLKMSPVLLNNHLKIDFNAKGQMSSKNDIDANGAISGALNMDPTKPVYGESPNNRFVGYYQNLQLNSNKYTIQGQTNPLAVLEQRTRPQDIKKLVANIETDYKMPFFPELRAVVNLGLETSESKLSDVFADNAIQSYNFNQGIDPETNYVFNPGENYSEFQTITNKTFDAYLMYSKKFDGFISRFETQAGHSYQSFVNDGYKTLYRDDANTGIREVFVEVANNPTNRYYNEMLLESYFERTNIDFLNKYLFTFTLRADASSLFNKKNRWGYFPAAGFAWKMKEESFLKNLAFMSDLKLRLGYGITGNQDIRNTSGYYPNTPLFAYGNANGQYLPGVFTYSARPYNSNLTWENTATSNIGLDFELFESKIISGSIDAYFRRTTDLLAKVPLAPGQSLTNEFTTNVGSLSNKGIELNLTLKAISKDHISWNLSANYAYNKGKVEDLKTTTSLQDDNSSIPNGTGNKIAFNTVGQEPYSALMYEQVYDNTGKPMPNVFVDRNGDGSIDEKDKYYVALIPNSTFGFGTTLSVYNFDLTASFRGQIGGKVYNTRILEAGWSNKAIPVNSLSLSNVLNIEHPFVTNIGNIPYSDYMLENASFLRCENITLGYMFDGFSKDVKMRSFVAVNNLFLATKYTGQDPENMNAIDNNFYPRPRVFSFGVNFDF